MQNIFRLSVIYAERHIQALYAECRSAECRGAVSGWSICQQGWGTVSAPRHRKY